MMNLIGKKVLITCANWFYAPNGKLYRGVFGTLKSINEAKSVLGFTPGRTHANWFIEVGDMVVTGCQVNYLVACEEVPKEEALIEHQTYGTDGVAHSFLRSNEIYMS